MLRTILFPLASLFLTSATAAVVCTSSPGFVNPVAPYPDPVTHLEEGRIDNNILTIAVRYPPGSSPVLVETSNNGNTNVNSPLSTTWCNKFLGASGSGWGKTTDTTTRADGCAVDIYTINLVSYLASPAPSTGFGCGTSTSGTTTLATTLGHFNILATDTTTGGRAPAGQIEYNNPLDVKMITPLQLTQQTVFSAAASAQFDPNSLSVTTYFTRQDLTSTGSLRILWSLNLVNPWKNLAYDTNPLSISLASGSIAAGTIQRATFGTAPTTTWSGELDVPITNFCSGFTNAAGTYTLNFKTANGASTPDTPGSISFVLPSADVCSSFAPVIPTLSLATYDATTNALTTNLDLGSTYYWLATVSSVYSISSVSFLPATQMVSASPAVTYNILPGSSFYTNQLMSRSDNPISNGYQTRVYFTVNHGPSTDPATDWFFLNNEISSTSTVVKNFQTTFALSIQYTDGQLNTHSRRSTDYVTEIPSYLVANATFGVKNGGGSTSSAGRGKASSALILVVVSIVSMLLTFV